MPVNSLPVELLSRILRYSYGPFTMLPEEYCLARDTAHRVCWTWRNVSVSDREAWANVYFSSAMDPNRVASESATAGELYVILELRAPSPAAAVGAEADAAPHDGPLNITPATSANAAPVEDTAVSNTLFVGTVCDKLGDVITRTTYLHISVPSFTRARPLFPRLRLLSAPSLTTLILENAEDTFRWGRVLAAPSTRLRALSLTNVLLSNANRELYANLRVLSLSFTRRPPDVPTIYELLAQTSRLEFLHLGELAFEAGPHHSAPTLPRLTHLQFDLPYVDTAALIVAVQMPALTYIMLNFISDACVESISDLCSFPSVRSLVLRMDSTAGVSLGRVVDMCPNVRKVEISVDDYDEVETPTDPVLASFQYLEGKLDGWWPDLEAVVLTRWDLNAEDLLPIFAGRSRAFSVFYPVAGDNGRGVMNKANAVDGAVVWRVSGEAPPQLFYYKTGLGDGI